MTFEEWLKELDRLFLEYFGVGYRDVEDYDWWAEYEGENTPTEAFEEWKLIAGPDA